MERQQSGKTVSEALNYIMGFQNQMFQSGNIDTEKSDIEMIIKNLKEGKISPDKAVEEVESLEKSRQDYH